MGPHFSKNRPDSNAAINAQSVHAHRMLCLQCDLSDLLEASRPPDPEFVDLIEQAFLEGQIDSRKAELAYLWLLGGHHSIVNQPLVDIENHPGYI